MQMSVEQKTQHAKFEKRKLTSRVYQLFPDPQQQNEQYDVEIVLFHGLILPGSDPAYAYWRTWKMRESEECWLETLLPKLLISEGRQYRARVLSVSYEGKLDLAGENTGTGASDDYLLVESLIDELIFSRKLKVGQKDGVPVFLVGHDLGGILIKELVIGAERAESNANDDRRAKLQKFLENFKSVFFYATPHSGAPIFEKLAKDIPLNTRNEMLRFMKVLNAEKSRVNDAFHNYRKGDANLKLAKFKTCAIHALHETEVEPYGRVMVIPEGTERFDVDDFYSDQADHFQVCQPQGEYSTSALKIADRILDVVQEQEASRMNPRSAQPTNHSKIREFRTLWLDKIDPAKTTAESNSGLVEVHCSSGTQASSKNSIGIKI